MEFLVAYAVNHDGQSGQYTTFHNTTVILDTRSTDSFTATDILDELILVVRVESPSVRSEQIALLKYWMV